MRLALALAVAPALVLAGCFGADATPDELRFEAVGGQVSPGWAYDGAGLVPGEATLSGHLVDSSNTGVVNVSFSYAGSTYAVVFDVFSQAPDKAFQDGGIAFDLDEHGSTGIGDAAIPKIHARAAAWGTATVARAGAPEGARWTAHLMLSEDTVRGADGKISNAAGGAYDPAKPDDARVVEGDPQAVFFVRHPDGESATKPPAAGSVTLTCSGNCDQSAEVPVEQGARSATINVTLRPFQGPVGAGQGMVFLRDAQGTDVVPPASFQLTPANAPLVLPFALAAEVLTGPLNVRVQGTGAYTATVDHEVVYDLHPFLVVTWDDITYG